MEVTLSQVLAAREERVRRQREWNRQWGLPQISFSMNIPGPVKDTPLIRQAFREGVAALEAQLPRTAVRHRQLWEAATGWEGAWVVALPEERIKTITTSIEDTHGLGRLFDMDVLDESLRKLDREAVGGGSRDCLVCGAPGRGCASRRLHSVPELQGAVGQRLLDYFSGKIGDLAVQSLLDEVDTTPKPGLVDRRNNGSHRDMDRDTFLRSAKALAPYFRQCARIGLETAGLAPEQTFPLLRQAGLEAERIMLAATGGVNTHKGAIFTLGILCGAAGRLRGRDGADSEIFLEVSAMTCRAMEADFQHMTGATAGQRLYAAAGIRGVRGEVARGLPTLEKIGLPAYRRCREAGLDRNRAGAVTLLHLIARAQDTCLLHRGGETGAAEAARRAAQLLAADPMPENPALEALDDWFIGRNLSPGGSADLLAAVYFLDGL